MSYKVSIIVPVYNCAEFVDTCIESLVNQTYENIEMLIIDDGSSDNSLCLCKEWEKIDSRIKVLSIEHMGVSVARNIGLENAEGEWICFVDSDDYCELSMIEELVCSAMNDEIDMIIGSFFAIKKSRKKRCCFYEGERIFRPIESVESYKALVKDAIVGNSQYTNIGVPWGRLYRKKFLDLSNVRFISGLSRMQDTIFNVMVFKSASVVKYIDKPVYDYRLREGSATTSYIPDFYKTAHCVINYLEEQLEWIRREDTYGDRFANEVMYAKGIALLSEAIKLELIPKRMLRTRIIGKIKEYEELFNLRNAADSIEGVYLTRNQKVIRTLMNRNMEWLLYIMLKIKYQIWRFGLVRQLRDEIQS